jgi:hypothetical protein
MELRAPFAPTCIAAGRKWLAVAGPSEAAAGGRRTHSVSLYRVAASIPDLAVRVGDGKD